MRKFAILFTLTALITTFPFETGHAGIFGKTPINRSISKSELIKNAAKPKDKIWVVDIWASWCVPCVASIPTLQELYDEYKDKDVEFISVSYDVKKKDWARAIRKHKMPWPQVLNYNPPFEEDEFKWMFPHSQIPTIYIIDENGTIDQMRDMKDLKYNLKALTAYK